ncbi:hypothetical protein H0H81_005727 [Sphagnurus paluster]|uniref:Uncharacterized protein n=1 Tax=Sphagnurus paluster TaxID=117069 RepID=A0A9P7GPF9_9AGAR|nr:hypothetical protein H0H81_005727 [Sphagnurus paluster]
MTTTWLSSGPIRHPWFTQPSAKRKISPTSSPDTSPTRSPSSSPSGSPPPLKRRRKNSALERGFSTLTLTLANPHTVDPGMPCVAEPLYPSDDATMDDDDPITIPNPMLPSAVEEPLVPEVRMKTSSWYEPEPDRIIITDLDSSSDEEDDVDPDTATMSISRAFLRKLSSRLVEPALPPPQSGTSQALVLFKPLPTLLSPLSDDEKKKDFHVDIGYIEDDAMEVEL